MTNLHHTRPIAVDLFAGCGGMTLGFEKAGFDVSAAVEIDPIHCATHKYNFPSWSILCQDVTKITGKYIRDHTLIQDSPIDVVFGGPPCQGFSLMGKRILDDPRNQLVFHFIRLVLELQPKYFVMENVKGMTLGKHKQIITEIIDLFAVNNYKVLENYQVLNAASYGVPQNRERLFLLGCQNDLQLPSYPFPTTAPPQISEKITQRTLFDLPKCPTVWDAIADLPEVTHYPELEHSDTLINATFGQSSDYAQQLRGFVCADNDYSYPRICDPTLLTNSSLTKHSSESMKRFSTTPPGQTEPISRFLKLDPQGLCNTLRAGTATNKGAFTSPRPIHPKTPRCITVREGARLHSYPDWFRFHITKWHGFRQIGNSVPPLLAQQVGSAIIKALDIAPTKPTLPMPLGDENLLSFDMTQAAEYFGVDKNVIEPRIRKPKEKIFNCS